MSEKEENKIEQTDKPNKALEIWQAKFDRLSAIELIKTLTELGAMPNQDRDRNKWKIVGIGNIIVKDQVWFNGNLQLSGYGSVKMVMHALNIEHPTEAMNWLSDKFPEELQGDWKEEIEKSKKKQSLIVEKSFDPPERYDEGIDEIRSYLINSRGLPPSLINREIEHGNLYATKKRDEKSGKYYGDVQCVFIGPSSAEIRSVETDGFKGCCKGSDSDRSGYQVMFHGEYGDKIALVEAAVDALSYNALNPDVFVLSTNGSGRFELQYKITQEAYRNGSQSIWAFDNDNAGDMAAQRLFNAIFLREKLSEMYDVPKELVDDWLIKRVITSIPLNSPHEIFINNIDDTEHKVFEMHRDESDPKEPIITWVDTGKIAPSSVTFQVLKASVPLKRKMGETFIVTPQDIRKVLDIYNVVKDTPKDSKDWNDIWKKKGQEGVLEYEKLYKDKLDNKKEQNKTEVANEIITNTKDQLAKEDDIRAIESNKEIKTPISQPDVSKSDKTKTSADKPKEEFKSRFSRQKKVIEIQKFGPRLKR